jgi:hypothetical protein
MAATKQRSTRSASRSGSGTNGSSAAKRSSSSNGNSAAKRSSSSAKRSPSSPKTRARTQSNGRARTGKSAAGRSQSKSTQSKSAQSKSSSASRTTSASSNGNVAQKAGEVVKTSVVPMATAAFGAAAGIAGGVVLGRTALARKRKIMGVKVPGSSGGLDNLAKNVGEAGKQFGRFAREVQTARQKAEEIGKALT